MATSEAIDQPTEVMAPSSREGAKEALADMVLGLTGLPADALAVAATLESTGLRDLDAQQEFGAKNIFALAEDVYEICRRRVAAETTKEPQELKKKNLLLRALRFIKLYLKGTMFAMPMTGQILLLLLLGYSLWAWLSFGEREATVIAVGTFTSYIVTGGFSQIISRRGMFYLFQGDYLLAKRVVYRFLKLGLLLTLVVAVAFYIFNLIIPIFEQDMILICLVYFVLLSGLWLNVSVLYMLEARLVILAATMLGVGFVWLVMTFTNWGIYVAHAIGIFSANVMAFAWGYQVLSRKARDVVGEKKLARLPRNSILAYVLSPYFLYGVLYFGFLFLDRVIGWSAPLTASGEMSPYIIWFRTPYEVGIDLALISLILTIAMLEYTIHEFSEMLIPVQQSTSGLRIPRHNQAFRSFYVWQSVLLALVAILSIFVAHTIVSWLATINAGPLFLNNAITMFVFYWGMIGYAFVAWGLLNALFLISLSRPRYLLRAIGLAFAVNVVVGFLLSRAVEYYYSVFGLVVGALVFGLLSTWYTWRIINSLDYYYYSSY
jgi:hypothetical protein